MYLPDGPVGQTPPPKGVEPDFEHPRDAGHKANVICLGVCTALIMVFFFIRCYVRLFIAHKLMLADWTFLLSWICVLLYIISIFIMSRYGLGYYSWEVTVEDYSQVLKWLYVSSIIYSPAAWLVKVTLLLLIARVFAVKGRVEQGIRIFIWVLLFIYTPIQTIKILICTPISAFWDPNQPAVSRCLSQRKVFIADLSVAIIADLVIVFVPIALTRSMNLPLRKKIKIIIMLSAGGAATAVTIFRMVKVILFVKSDDVTSDFVILDITTVVELTVGFVCACLPSANLMVERWTSTYRARRREKKWRSRPALGPARKLRGKPHYWWDSWTKSTRQPDENRKSRGVSNRTKDSNAVSTFDTELAHFTGRDVGSDDENDENGLEPLGRAANAGDGRREGWLASSVVEPGSVAERGTCDITEVRPGQRRLWTKVWDGSVADIPC